MSEQTNSTAGNGGHGEPFRAGGSLTFTTIPFYDVSLVAQVGPTPEETLVAMKPVVEGMGLDWKSQHRRLNETPVLAKGMVMMAIPSEGGPQQMVALPLTRLNFWLATIRTERVKDPGVRDRIIRYQTECADILFRHFFGQAARVEVREAAPDPAPGHIGPKPFHEWSLEEVRAHLSVVNAYRHNLNVGSAAWMMAQLGFPVPPRHLRPSWMQGEFPLDAPSVQSGSVMVIVPQAPNGRAH